MNLFKQLSKLTQNCDRIIITADKTADSKLAVSISGVIKNPDTEKSCQVRDALAKPVTVVASPEELDSDLGDFLSTFVTTFNLAAANLNDKPEVKVPTQQQSTPTEAKSEEPSAPTNNNAIDINAL